MLHTNITWCDKVIASKLAQELNGKKDLHEKHTKANALEISCKRNESDSKS